jgi:hypothetical protein
MLYKLKVRTDRSGRVGNSHIWRPTLCVERRQPTSVHDSESGTTSKICSPGSLRESLRVLEFCYFTPLQGC